MGATVPGMIVHWQNQRLYQRLRALRLNSNY
jgi:hypothetical protein